MSRETDGFFAACKEHGWAGTVSYEPDSDDKDGEPYTATVHLVGTTVVSHDSVLEHAISRSLYVANNARWQEG